MADAQLPATGSDTKIELLINAVSAKIIDQVTRFSKRPVYNTIDTKVLGTDNVDIDKRPEGWEGEIEVSRRTGQLDDFIDQLNIAYRNRVPQLIIITETQNFRDGTSRQHVYLDCKLDFGTESSRDSAVTTRITWRSGQDRI